MGRNLNFFPFFELMNWIYILGAGWLLSLLILIPALIRRKKIDKEDLINYEHQKEQKLKHITELQELINQINKEHGEIQTQVLILKQELNEKNNRISELHAEEDMARYTLTKLAHTEEQIKTNMEKSIEEKSEMLSQEYRATETALIKEYDIARKEAVEDFQKTINEKNKELQNVNNQIAQKQEIYKAIIEDERRKAKEESERDFYRLNISEEDLKEIKKIKEITPYLRNPEVLNKVLWSAYYQKPYQELIARLFNTNKPSGIYKIVSIEDNKIYIGQSVNVPNRFSEHIKRGLGAEPATKNRLYTAMKKSGVENFTFELIEEVSKDKLNERERYWIGYFQSAEFDIGLNGNKGVKD